MVKMKVNVLLLCLALMITVVACSPNEQSTASSADVEEVSVQLDWIHTIEYAGFYLADANNHYADQNLNVELNINDGSISTLDQLASGEVDFAVTGGDTLLLARERGEDVVAVATIYQALPLGFMSLAENQILTPADLSGQTVMLSLNRTSEYAFRAMANATGIDIDAVNVVPRTVFNEEPLLSGEVDVIDVFVTNQVVQMRRSDTDVNVILPLDYGVEMYVNVIATTQKMIDENPEVVERFVKATVQGLQDAVADAETATQAALERNPDLNHDSELESMRTSLPLIKPTGSEPGQMNPDTWEYVHDMLLEQGILSEPLDVAAAYNLSFLEQAYAAQ